MPSLTAERDARLDRLWALLPTIHRRRDAETNGGLRALLEVIAEQLALIEDDIGQRYDDWFIETCADWVVPYIGELVGVTVAPGGDPPSRRTVANAIANRRRKGTLPLLERLASEIAGSPARAIEFGAVAAQSQSLRLPRHLRGRTVDLRAPPSLLADSGSFDLRAHSLALGGVAGQRRSADVELSVWRLRAYPVTRAPAASLEDVGPHVFGFSLLGNDAPLFVNPDGGGTGAAALPVRIDREIFAAPERAPAGFATAAPELWGTRMVDGREMVRSVAIWAPGWPTAKSPGTAPIPAERVIVADLEDWSYLPPRDHVAVDPLRGRIVFPPRQFPRKRVTVSYFYGFSADIGGGEYYRPLSEQVGGTRFKSYSWVASEAPDGETSGLLTRLRAAVDRALQRRFRPGEPGDFAVDLALVDDRLEVSFVDAETRRPVARGTATDRLHPGTSDQARINAAADQAVARFPPPPDVKRVTGAAELRKALEPWGPTLDDEGDFAAAADQPESEVIEITDSDVYQLPIRLMIGEGRTLQIRAAQGARPVIRLADWQAESTDSMQVAGAEGARLILDGLLIAGRGLQIEGAVTSVTIRHCTLVPGWSLGPDCDPKRPSEPSIMVIDSRVCITIAHSIVGSIQVNNDEVATDPIRICVADSIVDATGVDCDAPECEALGAAGARIAFAESCFVRSTVIGRVMTHSLTADDSIFLGRITVARRQLGWMRFCHVAPASRTPRRFHCQPDKAEAEAKAEAVADPLPPEEIEARLAWTRSAVRPRFDSLRYGRPEYCRLAADCPPEISAGAEDGAEMGVFHHLRSGRRLASLRTAVDDNMPAGLTAAILLAD
ncbi:DUF4136 domain-containing protein [Sphingomonas parva]|uniref:DUF4136 domain-containing protein n=1 Tax=Sphingomonas parva TaxID=2555898 RepID=A0A4Y8ZLQ9_9SPHN|nr:DUF4136 domain-containing protein [Sphingomonas parva]TFI56941.1 DUF4136 domain-containing protein [Sphingomonas parva]